MTAMFALILATTTFWSGSQKLMMMVPLCFSIALVYKTIRCDDLHELPAAVGGLLVTIVLGMAAVGLGLWLLFQVMV